MPCAMARPVTGASNDLTLPSGKVIWMLMVSACEWGSGFAANVRDRGLQPRERSVPPEQQQRLVDRRRDSHADQGHPDRQSDIAQGQPHAFCEAVHTVVQPRERALRTRFAPDEIVHEHIRPLAAKIYDD